MSEHALRITGPRDRVIALESELREILGDEATQR
jgi:hypothetical protein